MNQQELQQFFTPFNVNKGTVVEGTLVEFEVKNNSPFPLLCYEQSCGCFNAELTELSFKGSLTASISGAYASTYQLLKAGDRYVQLHHTKNGPKFYDPVNSVYVPNEEIPDNPEEAKVVNFYQTVTLWLDDGLDIYRVSPKGQLEINPDKNRIVVPIQFLVIKK